MANIEGIKRTVNYIKRNKYFYILLTPCVIYFILFKYVPMYGVIIAFKDFSFSKGIFGSEWIGFENFTYMFNLSDFYTVFRNSMFLSFLQIVVGFPVPIVIALMINEVGNKLFKRSIQTIIYLPHFISWVVIGGILSSFLSPTWGVVNYLIKSLGYEPIFFLGKKEYFRSIVVLSSIWKEAGWGTIIYLAAISGINPELYEAAIVDGANRLRCIWHITLPGISSTIILLLILRMGRIMNNGFEQIYMLQNPLNLEVSEVFETFTYRVGFLGARFSFGTAVGLFTSVIGMVFLILSNQLSKRLNHASIW